MPGRCVKQKHLRKVLYLASRFRVICKNQTKFTGICKKNSRVEATKQTTHKNFNALKVEVQNIAGVINEN